jgi:hypothetical protein
VWAGRERFDDDGMMTVAQDVVDIKQDALRLKFDAFRTAGAPEAEQSKKGEVAKMLRYISKDRKVLFSIW